MLIIKQRKRFLKDLKISEKRNKDISKLVEVMVILANYQKLPPQYKDHQLKGCYIGCRECHIENDWLLIYTINNNQIIFERTGTHSDLF